MHGQAGLELLGAFASRLRGEVFLTEEDLRRFNDVPARAMLVMSGESAGFFVRERTRTIAAVCNYRDVATPESERTKTKPPWAAIMATALLAVATTLLAVMPLPRSKPHLREDHGQLQISWNDTSQKALTIVDGSERISLPLAKSQSSLTYVRQSGDVTVLIGKEQFRYIGPAPPEQAQVKQERDRVSALESRITQLRSTLAAGQTQLAKLESHSRYLTPH